jgi:hypothetical protein
LSKVVPAQPLRWRGRRGELAKKAGEQAQEAAAAAVVVLM